MDNSLNLLSSRAGFNTALRHFKAVNRLADLMTKGYNLADAINDALNEGWLQVYQIRPILAALLVDKFAYVYHAHSMIRNVNDVSGVCEVLSKWTNLQIVMGYHNPQTDLMLINPKNAEHWSVTLPLVNRELLVVYLSAFSDLDTMTKQGAIDNVLTVLYGGSVADKQDFIRVDTPSTVTVAVPNRPASIPRQPGAVSSGRQTITPRYSVVVTNELFHNGNVEAWKKIIESYRAKHVGNEVLVWYENERINDINTLFKWGKVKHGTPIVFSVAGEVIKGVAKLRRYLFEGASPRFEVFLRGSLGQTLDLF